MKAAEYDALLKMINRAYDAILQLQRRAKIAERRLRKLETRKP